MFFCHSRTLFSVPYVCICCQELEDHARFGPKSTLNTCVNYLKVYLQKHELRGLKTKQGTHSQGRLRAEKRLKMGSTTRATERGGERGHLAGRRENG